jgi:hypothetical protein
VILLVCGIAALALLGWMIPKRAPTLLVAMVFVAIGLFRRRREVRSPVFDFLPDQIYKWSITGGVLGELAAQLVFHIDPGAPSGYGWLLVGAGGIGGACGVALGGVCSLAVAGLVGGWGIWRRSRSAV